MTLNEYQEKAMTTCMPSCKNFTYMMLNLVGEVGEFAGKVAKEVRRGRNILPYGGEEELKKEAGDILWQLAGLCAVFGWPLEDVAQGNLDKLASRAERGVIDGNGDNR